MSVILLEHPRPKNFKRFEEVVNAPLSACLFTGYIASVLQENNIAPEIINAHLYDWSIEQVVTHLFQKSPRILCVHAVHLWEMTQSIFEMFSTVKSVLPSTHINLYGYYPTFAYERILTDFSSIDSITVGEPEITTLDLARHVLSSKDTPDEINVPGLAVRGKNGKAVFQPRPPIKDLDTLPFPVRMNVDLYAKKGIAAYIQGSRGCYNHCTFCYLNPFYVQATPWRGRSAKNIFEEIYQLYTKYNLANFYFSDANFFGAGKLGKDRAITLAELILTNNLEIRFGFECRANDIDEYVLSKLVMAGLNNVFLGLESGDPASLKRFKKHATVDDNKNAIRLLRDYGIEPTFGFIMFEPKSTLESIRNNFEFLKETGIMTTPAITAHLLHHKQTLFQGTPDYQSIADRATTNQSFTDYETLYKMNDPKAEAFYDVISLICRTALSALPETYDCENKPLHTESTSLAPLNDALITAFEETLSRFEARLTPDHRNEIQEMGEKWISTIKSVAKNAATPVDRL